MLVIVAFLVLALLAYKKVIDWCNYWKKKNIPYLKPWPLVGNMAENVSGTRSFAHIIQDMYEKFPNKRYFGLHHYSQPTIMLRDPELIKQICIKEADIFVDHPPFLPEDVDPFFNQSLLSLRGSSWKKMRAILSPAFTSSKLKIMFDLMMESAKQFVSYYEKSNGSEHVEIRDAVSRFTNDIAANLALGVRCDSLENRDNEVYNMAKKSFADISFIQFFGFAISPTLMRLFKIKMFDDTLRQYLSCIIDETIKTREEQKIFRPDMLHILVEAKKGKPAKTNVNDSDDGLTMTDDDLIAQAIFFFAGGFDTSSNLMCLLAYELALNPDVQKKLRNEIDNTLEKCGGILTYEALLEMKYLDMVISETQRLWPVTIFTDRMSARPYQLVSNEEGGKPIELDVGTYIWIPIYALHRDPKYFPDPDKFDPERFNAENKSKILPFTYIPFGLGPRNCIASRFALLETKVLFFYIISQFELVPVKDTVIPLKLNNRKINLVNEGDLILGIKPRKL